MTKKNRTRGRLDKPTDDSDSVADLNSLMDQTDMSDSDLYHNSYLSRGTIKRLRAGITRYPQHMTLKGIAAAAGYEYVLRKRRK